jgi:hypothetical protein
MANHEPAKSKNTGMTKFSFLALSILLLSCGNDKENKVTDSEEEATVDSIVSENATPEYNPDSKLYIWRSTFDYKKVKNSAASPSIIQADSLIKGLNEFYENVRLEKVKQSGDTLYTIIKESDYLTQQMGTTGAETYLADVILNLTSVPGIRYVKIDMTAGDHMQPGTWSAENFKNYKEVIQ